MNGYKIGIAVDIGADRVIHVRQHGAEGEAIIARWIEEEKDWVARCIELGFKTHGVRPEYGSSIEYKVINMEDGSIRIEGSQNIESDADKRKYEEEKRRKVLDAVQKGGGVTMEQLRGKSRWRDIVFCRFIAAKELYSRTCMSMSDIAELLGRDVKSVRYYMGMYEVNSRNFREFRELAGRIAGLLEGCGRSPE